MTTPAEARSNLLAARVYDLVMFEQCTAEEAIRQAELDVAMLEAAGAKESPCAS